jgi:SpoU rRNA methylase family enzyme
MATIVTKNSSTASAVPTTSDLVQGELAVNVTDKRIFTENASTQIVELGTNPSTVTTATATVTGTLTANGTFASSNAVITGGSVNSTPIGASTASTVRGTTVTATTGFVGGLTGNVTGNLTGNVTGNVTGDLTGNVTGNVTASSGTTTLNNIVINGTADFTNTQLTNITTPTASSDAANKGYVDSTIAAVIDSAPAALDTLNELAAALGDDANFSSTVTTALATKLPLAGGTMTGAIAMGTAKITGLGDPTTLQDAATKNYVDTADALKLNLTGGTMSGAIAMGTNKITGVGNPTLAQDAATKDYVDDILGSATSAATSAAAAATSASNAATSASNAASSATASSNSATASANSAAAAATSYDNFDDRYLGQKGTNPALDNDGDALLTGALYFNTSSNTMKVYTGSNWQDTAAIVTDITQGSLTKTFTAGESSTIALNQTVLAPVVSVTKEIPQTGVTSNSWDVNSTTENYTRLDSAYATTLDFERYDVSSASYTQSFSVAGQETAPTGIAFNTDGTKMFIVGSAGDDVNEYDLSIAFDISSAVYSQNFSVVSQESIPSGIAFNNDGSKMFVVGYAGQDINEYDLSTGFDVSTATYSQRFSVSAQTTTPQGMTFNNDGTKMFVAAGTAVYEYTLSSGFDVSTASYSQSFSVAAQDTVPTGIAFNTDGTKMFVVGYVGQDINEYDLSTGFDVSSASYVQNLSVSAQDTAPQGITFNPDGTKMFIVGQTGDAVFEYYLTPSLELGTGSFASSDIGKTVEANSGKFVLTNTDGRCAETTQPTSYAQVASGDWEMYGVIYNPVDGDLELSGVADPNLYFDITTAIYEQSFSVADQETEPQGVAFNNDGTKMYIVGSIGDDVNEYSLSIAFDISTAFFVDSFSVAAQETAPTGMAFNNDGTKMFIIGYTGDDVNEYNLSSGFDISTAVYSQNFSVSAQEATPTGITFNTDGTKMFVTGYSGQDVIEYDLSTGFDLSTAVYSQNFSVASQETEPQGVAFNSDGTRMFIVGSDGANVSQYTLETGFDVSTAYFVDSFSIASQDTYPTDIAFNNDGSKMYIVGATGDDINQYAIGQAYPTGYQSVHTTASIDSTYWTDINSMTADQNAGTGNVYYAISTDDRTTWTVIDNTGERDIVRNNAGTWQYNSNSAYASETWVNGSTNNELATLSQSMEGASRNATYDISLATFEKTFSVVNQDTAPQGVVFNTDGTKMFIIGSTGDDVNEYNLSTSFDVATAVYSQNFSVSAQDLTPTGIAFNTDGTKMFFTGAAGDSVYEYNLSTGFDVSTAVYSQNFSVAAQDTTPQDITFNTDGSKMFIVGSAGDSVYEYALSTGFDVSTASFVDSFSVAGQETAPVGIAFNADGTKMFVLGATGDDVNEYSLSTGFDVSTAVYSQSFSVVAQDSVSLGMTFNNDGTKMYIVGDTGDAVYQYDIPENYYANQMDKTQLDAVTDPNHIALSNDLDLAIVFNMTNGTTVPSSNGIAIDYDANVLNKGAILGTDYDFDAPAQDEVRITSLINANLKVRVV